MLVRFGSLVLGAALLAGQEFPPVKDWASVRIRLARDPGFCACPSYDVEISEGVMRYSRVRVRGTQLSSISRQDLEQLINEFRLADYMRLDSGKGGQMLLDGKADRFFVSIDGQRNEFADYGTQGPAETQVLRRLENAIDQMVNAAYWVNANEGDWVNRNEALAAIRLGSLVPRRAPSIIAWVLTKGDRESVRSLIRSGAALSDTIPGYGAPLVIAAWHSDPEVLELLIEAGASKDEPAVKEQALDVAVRLGRRRQVDLLTACLK